RRRSRGRQRRRGAKPGERPRPGRPRPRHLRARRPPAPPPPYCYCSASSYPAWAEASAASDSMGMGSVLFWRPAGTALAAAAAAVQLSSRWRPVGALVAACSFLWAATLLFERGLGMLAGWGIGKTPKRFWWTIDRIRVWPSLSWDPGCWSEICVVGWTWHNPPGFRHGACRDRGSEWDSATDYILQIDRLTLRLELGSVLAAVRRKKAICVDKLHIEGLRFRTVRNREAELNLWAALDLPDDDVNVSAILEKSRRLGGMNHVQQDGPGAPKETSTSLKPLPAIATKATRKAARFWKPQWFRGGELGQNGSSPPGGLAGGSVGSRRQAGPPGGCLDGLRALLPAGYAPSAGGGAATCSGAVEAGGGGPGPEEPEAHSGEYVEFAIGDKRRRPRWGVPVRFDIRKLVAENVELWILDLLTVDAHRSAATLDSKIQLPYLLVERERLERGDPRRAGAGLEEIGWPGDGVHGVYLGELVWVLIAEVVPLAVVSAPSRLLKNALFAAGVGIQDVTRRLGAGAIELAYNAAHYTSEVLSPHHEDAAELQDACRIHVHLIKGRNMTVNGKRVNVSAHLELNSGAAPTLRRGCASRQLDDLLASSARIVSLARADSAVRLWTKFPKWDEHFYLGPVTSIERCTLRISCIDSSGGGVFGQVLLPVSSFRITDSSIDRQGDMVGWFPLEPTSGTRCTGQLKLGLRVLGADKLAGWDASPAASREPLSGRLSFRIPGFSRRSE
ncbi:unnamed protein product, partial [Prorocentrum cordatum]